MVSPPTPPDEARRLDALRNLCLLDTPPEPRFDRITRLACIVAQVPIALISLVDVNRQWFKSRQGLEISETPREISFCGHAILQAEPLIVADAREDLRFEGNPAVIGEPFVRFYAGFPIHAPEGERVGTLCVVDTLPRHLTPQVLTALSDLAALVDAELLAQRFDVATRAAGIGLHDCHSGSSEVWWSDAMWEIYGQDRATFRPSQGACLALVHPEDQAHVQTHAVGWGKSQMAASLRYRIVRPDGTIRHVQSIASTTKGYDGTFDRIAGITLDITERAEAEQRAHGQQQQLRESSHQAGMAEIATSVLHSVGNVVNSLGIAHATMRRDLRTLRVEKLEQASTLIRANRENLSEFLTRDEHGRHLPDYLQALSAEIALKARGIQSELDTTDVLLEHLRDIVSAQQAHALVGGQREVIDLRELLEIALKVQAFDGTQIEVIQRFEPLPSVSTDRHKLLLILMNILSNAGDAVMAADIQPRRITVKLFLDDEDAVISIEDSGVGMSPEVVSQLWRYGFTTKPNGAGFDLHNSANAAREIGATIAAHSDGTGKGSRFVVRLPTRKW